MKRIELKNWKKFTLEYLSIFIAVVSAFALNNWNDNRNSRRAENKILIEIYNGLEKDLEDIHLNERGHKKGIQAIDYFRDLLNGKNVPADSVLLRYVSLTRNFISIQNTSGYQTLKSRGIELIENDSIRMNIISLYEYDYNTLRKLEEEYFELQFQKNYFQEINNIIAQNFIVNSDKQIVGIETPLKMGKNEEKILLTYLWKIEINRRFILQYYSKMGSKIERLREEIKNEIKQ